MIFDLRTIQENLNIDLFSDKVVFFDEVDSTNTIAKQLAGQNAPAGTVVIANRQTGGRGRFARPWHSPPDKGVWMSLITRPLFKASEAIDLPTKIGHALQPVFTAYGGGPYRVKLPNDILAGNRKICGILCESAVQGERLDYVIIGIGINVLQTATDFPPELQKQATSLLIETGVIYNRIEVIDDVLQALYDSEELGVGLLSK